MFTNLATGQILNTCDFFAYISSINWCSCTTDEVWLGNGTAKSGYDWFMYFQTNTPTCANQAPTCMSVHINDADQPGETLHVLSYPAIGIPTPTKTYQWEQSIDGITWSPIGGAIGTSFVITTAQVGKYVRVKGTATNGIGSPAVCYSGAVPIVPANASPTNTIAPVISGGTTQGSVLTCTTGTWAGFPTPAFSFTWFADGVQVGTGNTYTLNLSDSLKNITCVVTANNGINPNGTATSNTITAGDYAPQNTIPPIITGGSGLGSMLTCFPGTWAGTNITYSYQWFSGALPVGDDSAQYQLQITDTLANITCVVTAANPAGSNFATSNTITAGDYSPYNTIAPIISVVGGGPATPGVTLKCQVGTWVGYGLAYSFQWYRGATPVGTNTDTYLVTIADQGASITCVVTATNAGGSGSATSNNINVPSGPGVSAPSNSTPPTIAVAGGGSPTEGATLSVSVGTWNGTSPIAYTYEWFSGIVSVGINPYYIIQASDIGNAITCQVTATNAYGNDTATSNSITAISVAPSNVVAPVIYGNNTPGDVLSVAGGTWAGSPSPSFTYNWQWSSDGGATWNNYSPTQTGATKTVISADVGRLVRCVVTGTNLAGVATANTNNLLIDQAPQNTVAPVASGTLLVGSVLSVTNGTWTGSGTITYTYRWLRNGVAISGATSSTYTTVTADAGQSIRAEVTGSNGLTSIALTNALVPTLALTNTLAPTIYGTYTEGSTLTAVAGNYSGHPTPTITRKWQFSTNGGVSWNDYSPAQTGTTYTVQTGETGRQIRVLENADNGIGSPINTPSNVATIIATGGTQRPENTVLPTITGTPAVGNALTCSTGTWNNSPTGYNYQWYTENGVITGATSSTYTPIAANASLFHYCIVTATNAGGNEPAQTANFFVYDADFYAAHTTAVANGATAPTTTQLRHFSKFITEAKILNLDSNTTSIYSKLDRLFLFANNGSSAWGCMDFKTGVWANRAILVSSPTWTANLGVQGNGTTSYIDTNFNPTVGTNNYVLNNAGRYAYITQRTTATGSNQFDGTATSNINSFNIGVGINGARINQGTSVGSSADVNDIGFQSIVRLNATENIRSTDLNFISTVSSTSVAAQNQFVLRSGTSYNGVHTVGLYAMGAGIQGSEIVVFRNLCNKYLNDL